MWRTPWVALMAIALAACSGNQSMFNPQGPVARNNASVGWFLIWLMAVVYVAVMCALAIAVLRRRRASDDSAESTRRLARTVTWASIATVIVLVSVGVIAFAADRGMNSPSGPGAITVDVIGHQWWWDFQYRDLSPDDFVTSPNELHIPVGVPVVLSATSRDVIHSFWVPNLRGKRDLIPGIVSHTWLQAETPGVFRGL